MHERRFNPAQIHKLEDPERLIWLPPAEMINRLALAPGMIIADVGAGSGFFSIPMAQAVAPQGAVWAIDVQPEMLRFLAAKLDRPEAPRNIELQQGDAVHTGLHAHSCDLVLLANVWHELGDRAAALEEARRILSGQGRLAILDWRTGVEQPPGPPIEHRIALKDAAAELRQHQWHVLSSGPFGPYNYLLIATP